VKNSKKQDKSLTTSNQDNNSKKQKQAQGIAGSMLFDGLLDECFKGLFGGKVVHMSFDCPENLRKAFVETVKLEKSSACKILQKYMALHVLKATLTKHALGNTLSRVVDVPLRVGEVRFEQYVQSRPRRFGRSVVVDDGEGRFYCALKNEHVERQSLPLSHCFSCPNSSCRSFLLRKGEDEGFE
jgi:hypothetical protein